jgi:hypothetical protein
MSVIKCFKYMWYNKDIVLHIAFIASILKDIMLIHNLYSSPSIIRMIKSRRMRLAGHVARMREKRNTYRWESRKEGDHWEDEDEDGGGWTILNCFTTGGLPPISSSWPRAP